MKLRKGDNIIVTRGKDKGKEGSVEKVFKTMNKVLVVGVNEYKRHIKKSPGGQKSEIITITKPLPAAAVALVCPKCKKPTRIGYKIDKDLKVRICRKCKKEI